MTAYAKLKGHLTKTKKMPKQNNKRAGVFNQLKSVNRAALLVGLACVMAVGSVPLIHADQYDAKIQKLQEQNAHAQSAVGGLQVKAKNYQDAIEKLQAQIALVQQQIALNREKQAELKQKIAEYQKEIEHQRKVLGEDLRSMYTEGQMSTIEMLATSKNLSDYLDKEQYRLAVQSKIQDTLKEITQLQQQLEVRKNEVERLLKQQQSQQVQLDSDRAEKNRLLSYNEAQQASYNKKIQKNNGEIEKLRQEQIAANFANAGGVVYGGTCGGGYPANAINKLGLHWGCNYAQDNTIDNWGMYNRECVSYAAFKAWSIGRYVPYGLGNAGDWPYNVPANWIVSTPRAGDVAVRPANPNWVYPNGMRDVGHVMFVERNNGDGTIAISQYNASYDGTYSYVGSRTTAGLIFIRFPGR